MHHSSGAYTLAKEKNRISERYNTQTICQDIGLAFAPFISTIVSVPYVTSYKHVESAYSIRCF